MLKLVDISVSFHEAPVLSDLSCHVEKGDLIVIEGANGSGKSTLFDVIIGKTQPQKGEIWLEDILITKINERKRASFIRRMSQNTLAGCFPSLTVAENLALALMKEKIPSFKKGIDSSLELEIKEMLDPFGLTEMWERPIGMLSGGQRQIVAFLMTVLTSPKLLLLDEPTAALDPQAAERFLSFALDTIERKKMTALLITHDVEIAKKVGNKQWKMEKGKITCARQSVLAHC